MEVVCYTEMLVTTYNDYMASQPKRQLSASRYSDRLAKQKLIYGRVDMDILCIYDPKISNS